MPIPSIVIRTRSPGLRLKSSGGTIPVPVNKNDAGGKNVVATEPVDQLIEAASHARDAGFALINDGAVALDLHADADRCRGRHGLASVIDGPRAQHASYTLACGKYRGFSPSMSRALTSLPTVMPLSSSAGLKTRASSGSGTHQIESRRTRIA